ncbi:hypothetical protein Goshw_011863, partial [Gossypium schwendimanii]|nr:hypothetical protein [Gossypium schwendimanii]
MQHYVTERRSGKIWVHIFLDKPVMVRPTKTRMGSRKGSFEYWCEVRGRVSKSHPRKRDLLPHQQIALTWTRFADTSPDFALTWTRF